MKNLITTIGAFLDSLPSFVLSLLVLILGWAAALFLRFVFSRLLDLARFNKLCDRTGISGFLRKGQVNYLPSKLVGIIAYWTALLITFLQISKILDIKIVVSLYDRLGEIAPGALAALLIIVIGLVITSFVGNFVMTLARNAGYQNAELLTRAVKTVGVVLVFGLALEQINLEKTILGTVFLILFGAAVAAAALAFGLGCKDIARDAMQRFLRNLREKSRTHGGSDLEG